MNAAANKPADFALYRISFTLAGRTFSDRVRCTLQAAYARLDLLVDVSEEELNMTRLRHLAPLVATNCRVLKIEEMDAYTRAQLAIARGDGAARRANGS